MSTLRSRKDHRGRASGGGSFEPHLDALVTQELHHWAAMHAARPIAPEQWVGADLEGMQQDTHPARVSGGLPVPLTLLAQGTGAAVRDPGLIDDAQAPRTLPAVLPLARAPCLRDSAPCRLAGGQSPAR